jgi:aryl-alcohol dehydrogenase-like predicted oxidoreductase
MQDERLEKVKKLVKVAEKMDTTLATLSIAWCIHNPNVTTAILGATKEMQLMENLDALNVYPKLTAEIMNEIDAVMGSKP